MMTDPGREKRFQELASAALTEEAKLAAELERRRGEPPQAGDVYALPGESLEELEWALVEADGEGFVAVPADVHPLTGRGDVVLDADAPCGDLRLRCASSLWIGADLLAGGRRTGFLDAEDLGQVRRRLRRPDADGEILDDEDPDYEGWIQDVVRPALAALKERGERRTVLPFAPREPRTVRLRTIYALAASFFFFTTVALLLWMLALRQVPEAGPGLINLALHELRLAESRRGVEEISLPETSSHLVLVVPVADLPDAESYTLTVADEEGRTVLELAGLVVNEYGEFILAIPRGVVDGGVHIVELWGVDGAERRQIARREVRLTTAP